MGGIGTYGNLKTPELEEGGKELSSSHTMLLAMFPE